MSDLQSNRAFIPSNKKLLYSRAPFPSYPLLPPRPKDGEEIRKLWCLVYGDTVLFEVRPGTSFAVDHLKELILFRQGLLGKIAAVDVVLWKLNDQEPLEPETTLAERIELKGYVRTFATRLTAEQKVSTLFPQPPPEDCLHIFVQLPFSSRRPNVIRINASPRTDTVIALYKRLKKYCFIQVCGTPASGKTVLAQLLADFISRRDPDVNIVWVDGWPEEVKASGNYRFYLAQLGWVEHEKTVFIFDEAQLTYEDPQLWDTFFKSIHDYKKRRAIVFTSYGNPMPHNSIKGTNMTICDPQHITLRHVDHEDGLPPAGLLFTRTEFNTLVNNYYHPSDFRFDSSFFDGVFDFTNGHVGAIRDFMKLIFGDDSYRNLKGTARSKRYTWDSFLTEVDPQEFLRKLENSASIIGKGLPSNTELQVPATARIFSAVLRGNFVTDTDFTTDEKKTALQLCFHKGWLHAHNLGVIDLPDHVEYFFPSPLHRWYVEWKLSNNLPPAQIQANSLLDFVIDAIRLFSPRLLSAERRIGPSCIQRLPEALYQDELYRCSHILSKGSLVTFPEYVTAKGRVDLYIPAKSWGIELLHNGDQLANHFCRFSDEPGSCKAALPLSDSIVIDCRSTHPKEEHPNMPKLYHAVFEDNFENVCILDNRLRLVSDGKFRLSASS